MLGVHERRHAAGFLRLGHRLQRQRRLAGRLRTVDLDHAALRESSDAQRCVDGHRTARDYVGRDSEVALAHPQDGSLAVVLLDLTQRLVEVFLCLRVHSVLPSSRPLLD